MKAVVYREYGSPEGLRVEDVPAPTPGPRDVLVRVFASSINAADLEYLHGTPFLARMGSGIVRPHRRVLGFDVAGTVESAGADVSRHRPGDAVFSDLFDHGFGGFAEFVCAPESAFASMPQSLSFQEAAAIPHSGVLAIQGLKRGEHIEPGHEALINGAGGCVGPLAIQMAKAYGAVVTAVDRESKLGFMESLGADHVIDFEREDYTLSGKTYDWILDLAAHRPLIASRRALSEQGRYVMAGGPTGRFLRLLAAGPLLTMGTHKQMSMLMWKPFERADVDALTALVESGDVRPRIDRVFQLEEVPDALQFLERGEARGKLVVRVVAEEMASDA